MNVNQTSTMNNITWAMLLLLAFIWGGSFLFGRIAVLEIPPLTTAFFRVFLAAIALWLFILFARKKLAISWWFVGNITIMAILNNAIPFSFILYGQKEIGSGLASIINAMTPIWTILIANWLTQDEKISPQKIIGIICGFLGVAILMGMDALNGLTASALAQGAVMIATISYGFAAVFGKRFKGQDPIFVSAGQLTASSLVMLVVILVFEDPFSISMPSQVAIWSVLGLAIPCTAFAYILFFKILANGGATNVSLVTFLVPVSAIILGILVLNESLSLSHIAGMILIAIGLIILDGRLSFLKSRS